MALVLSYSGSSPNILLRMIFGRQTMFPKTGFRLCETASFRQCRRNSARGVVCDHYATLSPMLAASLLVHYALIMLLLYSTGT